MASYKFMNDFTALKCSAANCSLSVNFDCETQTVSVKCYYVIIDLLFPHTF